MLTSPGEYWLIAVGCSSTGTSAVLNIGTVVRSMTGRRSLGIAPCESCSSSGTFGPAAKAGVAAPSASAATDAASAMRTARVMGASLILRARRVLADPSECFMPLI